MMRHRSNANEGDVGATRVHTKECDMMTAALSCGDRAANPDLKRSFHWAESG